MAWMPSVAEYYDRNTRRFLLMGGRGSSAIHRELWAPGVSTPREATAYVDELIVDEISGLSTTAPTIIDFGCGVGGTLFRLAGRFPEARLLGITLSRRQVDVARGAAAALDVCDRASFRLADFQTVDPEEPADVVYSVEAFAHATDPDAYLANAARHLKPGGHVIVVDDFLADDAASRDARRRRTVERFKAGWRVPAVDTAERLVEGASGHGLAHVKTTDLTSLTRPGYRLRDRVTALVAPALAAFRLAPVPFCGNLIGGDALQTGMREGFIRYLMVVMRRVA